MTIFTGVVTTDANIIPETGREALRIKEPVAADKIFDFSMADAALK